MSDDEPQRRSRAWQGPLVAAHPGAPGGHWAVQVMERRRSLGRLTKASSMAAWMVERNGVSCVNGPGHHRGRRAPLRPAAPGPGLRSRGDRPRQGGGRGRLGHPRERRRGDRAGQVLLGQRTAPVGPAPPWGDTDTTTRPPTMGVTCAATTPGAPLQVSSPKRTTPWSRRPSTRWSAPPVQTARPPWTSAGPTPWCASVGPRAVLGLTVLGRGPRSIWSRSTSATTPGGPPGAPDWPSWSASG